MKFRNPFKSRAAATDKSSREVRQVKIDSFYRKKGKKHQKQEEKKLVEEVEGREPTSINEEAGPQPEDETVNKAASADGDIQSKNSTPVPNKSTDHDGDADAAENKDAHLDEKTTEEPESPRAAGEEPTTPHTASNIKDDEAAYDATETVHSTASKDPSTAAPAPATPESSSNAKQGAAESRDPPPRSTPDLSFCGCF